MKTYVPKIKPTPVQAFKLTKPLQAQTGDYLVILPDGRPCVMQAERFESLYTPGEKSKTRRRRKQLAHRYEVLKVIQPDKGLTAKEIASLLPEELRKAVSARLVELCKEKLITYEPQQGGFRYFTTTAGEKMKGTI